MYEKKEETGAFIIKDDPLNKVNEIDEDIEFLREKLKGNKMDTGVIEW